MLLGIKNDSLRPTPKLAFEPGFVMNNKNGLSFKKSGLEDEYYVVRFLKLNSQYSENDEENESEVDDDTMNEIRNIFGGKNKPEVSISFKDEKNAKANFENNLKSPNENSNKNEDLSSDIEFNSEGRIKAEQIFGNVETSQNNQSQNLSSKSNKIVRNNYMVQEHPKNLNKDLPKTIPDSKLFLN